MSEQSEHETENTAPPAAAEAEPFFPYVTEEDYPETLKPVLEPYKKRMGFIPNALKLYMHRPEIAEGLSASASAGEKPAATMAMRIACSWNSGTPRVLASTCFSSSDG